MSSVRDLAIYIDADTSHENSRAALQHFVKFVKLVASKYVPFAGSGSCYLTVGLGQRRHDRPPCLSDAAAAVGSQFGCAANQWISATSHAISA